MSKFLKSDCPECDTLNRRDLMVTLGAAAGALAIGTVAGSAQTTSTAPAQQPQRQAKPAEDLIRELFATLSDEQKRNVVKEWGHAWRRGMYNAPQGQRIEQAYTAPQRELVERVVKAMLNGEEGYRKISRNNSWDGSRSLTGCGAYIFGDPTTRQFAFVLMGHHLTIRCDGNSEANAAFGGPIYYGHSPDGWSNRNAYFYQTRAVQAVFDSLNEQQRGRASVTGSPGEGEASVRLRQRDYPGLVASDLTRDQTRLVETVMRTILDPYRQEDGDEVMQLIRRNGGLEKIHLAFYKDRGANDNNRWHFWRLEGPGFVWNYRVLPHVHTFVNIAGV